ncbi:amino acid ABC transporter substrate-binding protein [Cryobacterium sp. TMT1-21]|uniref:Amino acid ABC transporter substrate-binding protein n=1 Tax=Cryobacterium shii TaxID=1259235 RepID=A0AAQ2HEK9_9MICO|nr:MULTISPECIES: ABC transporter substrate-binding protein [Cryobacterium]TFC43363.1 amino acid ABC transporter substrate-binding protein [Cryobacterium shii]TFD10405.1 amino acid ABC transporter substrate-binding protein [Cryobacterium sp. TMT1-21]TFD18334.1 amino acid ABC transporter substrate-binding protein [Cryobacterium sp. TMT4-10]TFD27880.1 amino acid ABC transporter substrate-binding protein [Cryobacterium sp. TMT2-23]TFD39245.1 amino acid ABC transporter substrate-binding protein [Cr
MSVFAKASASRSVRAVVTGVAMVGVSALLLTGCSSNAAEPAASESPAASGDAQTIKAGDRNLTLKIGTVLPQSGALAFLGPPEEAGVALAVKDINDADLGMKIEPVYRDSGDTTTDTATVSVTDLLSQDVSAIIGAASSGVSKTVIDQITGAGVVQFSPANTSADFTKYADKDLYWRTAPSDLLQGEVLGNQIAEDGNSTLGLIVLNDSYGTGLADSTTAAFEAAGGKVVAKSLFNEGDSNFAAQISEVTAANPDAIALVTFDQAKVITPALVGSGFPGDKLYFVDGNLADYSKDFAPGLVAGSKGTLPGLDVGTLGDFTDRLKAVDPTLTDFSYAAESYDAVMLVALAAYAANDVKGTTISKYLRQVSGGTGDGTKVTDFKAAAKALAAGDQVNYDGFSGPVTFDEYGDPTEATIGVYEYAADNTYARIN